MNHRLQHFLAWLSFASLLFGVVPLAVMTVGYQVEKNQAIPSFGRWSCEDIEAEDSAYQQLSRVYKTEAAAFSRADIEVEPFDAEKCRIAGSGSVTVWVQEGKGMGFIYAKLSERQMRERLGYRTFFADLSHKRWLLTALIGALWLPIVLSLYWWTGTAIILPWRGGP